MSDVAIRVENLGKMYRIGGKQEKYSTLRDTLVDIAAAPYRKIRGLMRGESASGLKEEIWALKDVSFEVKHGEVVGIIGRNGAGKSTLLKILSRITEPTTGFTDVYGRVGALLEVGTGFHPELTGRENVYLNGAILGMTRRDIDRKFDEIVDFSGVERFIDTPVKHYSSGMGLRLGFAVAAHLEPEILVVDEVLAVGDAEFQNKCLGKMSEVAGEGRTVLFVSHNMRAVQDLCTRGILLSNGLVEVDGSVAETISKYLDGITIRQSPVVRDSNRNWHHDGNGMARIVDGCIKDANGIIQAKFIMGEQMVVEYRVESSISNLRLTHAVEIVDESGFPLIQLWDLDNNQSGYVGRGSYIVTVQLPKITLYPSRYLVNLWIGLPGQRVDRIEHCLAFEIINHAEAKRDFVRSRGVLHFEAEWKYSEVV
jgi:lipopolysaccharide transport system ATP-binding protein